ncbi:hypothetical protein [Dactylosporangium sp. CA-233914]|uniref:hypothetical protein n=1 Tax=Dactylosporangium sp. CA-233914 TaxID=3239934 RepID=UPI003D8FB186
MIDAPADYTGRRRAHTQGSLRIALVAVLIVSAGAFIALRALPGREPGHQAPYAAEDPVIPALSIRPPSTGSPPPSPASSASPSPAPTGSSRPTPTRSPSPAPTTATVSRATPSGSTGGTTSGVFAVEAEAPGNGRSGTMTVREVPGASGGRAVGNVGNGRALAFTGVTVPRRGEYRLTIAYLSTRERRCYISAGRGWVLVTFPGSGGPDTVATVTVTVRLEQGRNTVEAGNTTGRWCPDLDRITVAPTDHPSSATS